MLINLSDVFTSEGKQIHMEVPLSMQVFASKMGTFEMKSKSDVTLTLTNVEAGKALIEGTLDLEFATSCDRCLCDVITPMHLDFHRIVLSPELQVDEQEEEDTECFMEGYQLNVETFVYHEILCSWPAKILCQEDCKGLCMKCGQNLNVKDCGCDTFVPDPRMAVIQDIFNANKEV